MTIAYNKRKGASAELELVELLKAAGLFAVRQHLNGVHDEGDVIVYHPNATVTIYEVKAASKGIDLQGWLRELKREVANTRRARPGVTVKGILAIRLNVTASPDAVRWAMVEAWP